MRPIWKDNIRWRASDECSLYKSGCQSLQVTIVLDSSETVRIDFIRRIPANHVFNRLVSSRVKFDPRIDLEHSIIENDDMFAISDLTLNVPP
jgi:hypothetical protein